MKVVKLDRPTKFAARGRVHVTDGNGLPFYVFDRPQGYNFSLPAGTYRLDNGTMIGPLNTGRPPKRSALRYPLPAKVVMRVAPNPHTCSIDLKRGVIYADPKLLELPPFCLVFVLFHEIGHYFYNDESACDKFAADEMLWRGYNPSQVQIASKLTLSDKAGDRKACTLQHLRRA